MLLTTQNNEHKVSPRRSNREAHGLGGAVKVCLS